MELSNFVGSLLASRDNVIAHDAVVFRSGTHAEADKAALALCKKKYPKEEGWGEWSVSTRPFWIETELVARQLGHD